MASSETQHQSHFSTGVDLRAGRLLFETVRMMYLDQLLSAHGVTGILSDANGGRVRARAGIKSRNRL
jgi:hypothetical protein